MAFGIFLLVLGALYWRVGFSLEVLHFYLSAFVGFILIILIIFAYKYYFIILPFFARDYQKLDLIDDLVNGDKSRLFYAYKSDGLIITSLLFYEYKSLEPFYRFSYYEPLFYGIYVRARGSFAHKFKLVADKKLLFLYEKNAFFMRASLSDNVEFNRKFKLYLSNSSDFKFFSPAKLERICRAAKPIRAKISLIFRDDFCELYIHNFIFSKNIAQEILAIKALLKEFHA